MKNLSLVVCMLISLHVSAQKNSPGVFDHYTDVGNPKIAGNTVYDKKEKQYNLSGGGYNIWFNRDEFHYAYKQLKSDFTLTANFEFVGEGKEGHRKIGWMVRASLADSAVHISAVKHGDGLTVLQWRVQPGMNMRDPEDEIFAKGKGYSVMQLQRKGNTITMRAAKKEGDTLQLIGEHTMDNLPEEVLAGIFICSHNPDVLEQAKVCNVKVEK